ncbi:unnamed protein product [Amoebophrya sp. A25]|nr:unnamed protein product [Amoebophrya sp. A25]|eukprot:GSA25T00025012001.1
MSTSTARTMSLRRPFFPEVSSTSRASTAAFFWGVDHCRSGSPSPVLLKTTNRRLRRFFSTASPASSTRTGTPSTSSRVGFIGIGRMGAPMSAHLHKKFGPVSIWNRTPDCSAKHSAEHGTLVVNSVEDFECPIVFCCLPTSKEVRDMAERLIESKRRNGKVSTLIDCTSGSFAQTIATGELLAKEGISLVDCPISGGPRGAQSGTLTAMLGGNNSEHLATASELASAFANKVEQTGPLGSAHAVKSINNILNSANLAVAVEGLLALRKVLGPDLDIARALACINASSGRSLQSEARVPEEVLSRRFGYGFDLLLMQKDCSAARELLTLRDEETSLLPRVARLLDDAASFYGKECEAARKDGDIVDYTYIARYLEEKAGYELRGSSK